MNFVYLILSLSVITALISLFGKSKPPKNNTGRISLPSVDSNYKTVLLSAILAIILTHVFIYLWHEDLFKSWFNSKAFWFSLGSIVCASLVRIFLVKKNLWYYFMIAVLPIASIYEQYSTESGKQDGDSNENAVQKIATPDTTKRTFDMYLITTFSHNDNVELEMPPNTEVLQERSEGFKQVTRTDSVGFKINEVISGDRFNAPSGRTKFTIKQGGPVTLKVWRD